MQDLHTHTVFSDGKDTPEEMVRAALQQGLTCIGISDHAHAVSDSCGMPLERREEYRREISRLKAVFAGQIQVLCGLERDYYSDDFYTYDYVIGSVHSIRMQDGYYLCVDWEPDRLMRDIRKYFGGDGYAFAEAYYMLEADAVRKTRCDIIGHFDLLTKFNEKLCFLDEENPRYIRAWQRAADILLKTGKPFEVNTGAISRGCRTVPYPSGAIRDYLKSHGGKLVLASDAHRKEHIAYGFQRWEACLQK